MEMREFMNRTILMLIVLTSMGLHGQTSSIPASTQASIPVLAYDKPNLQAAEAALAAAMPKQGTVMTGVQRAQASAALVAHREADIAARKHLGLDESYVLDWTTLTFHKKVMPK
jgi:hypothetical protein